MDFFEFSGIISTDLYEGKKISRNIIQLATQLAMRDSISDGSEI